MGLASSAALEIATLKALAQLARREFEGTELARLGQLAENELVGTPCGLMDQLTSAYGRLNTLLPILCRPDKLSHPVTRPDSVMVVGWPSGVKHDVGASPYATARTATFMGKKIVETKLEREGSYASEISPALFHQVKRSTGKYPPFMPNLPFMNFSAIGFYLPAILLEKFYLVLG